MDDTATHSLKKNPSREQCEETIRRILNQELLEKGCNTYFKHPSDFMPFFESLYPASESLSKQVQRALKSLNLPKSPDGYYLINKTKEQLDQDLTIRSLLQHSHPSSQSLQDCVPYLLIVDLKIQHYLIELLSDSITFQGTYETMCPASNGILFYTRTPDVLESLLHEFLSFSSSDK